MKLFKHILIALFLLSISFGCEEDKPKISVNKETSEIQSLMDDGSLLVKITRDVETYIFTFESGTVRIPVDIVASVHEDYENWNTVLTFIDQQEISIPTLQHKWCHKNNPIESVRF